mgnify:CR=1 FL=1
MELLWLGLFALPVIAIMMWFERNILRGEWLKDEPEEETQLYHDSVYISKEEEEEQQRAYNSVFEEEE